MERQSGGRTNLSNETSQRLMKRLVRGVASASMVMTVGATIGAASAQGSGTIIIGHSRSCIDLPNGDVNDNVPITQFQCDGTPQQAFAVVPAGTGIYNIKSSVSGKCLTVYNASTFDNAPITQSTCSGTANQAFSLAPVGSDFYTVTASHSGKCLTVPGGAVENNVGLTQVVCTSTQQQMYWFQDLVGMNLVQPPKGQQQPAVQQPQAPVRPALPPQTQQPVAAASAGISQLVNRMNFNADGQSVRISPDGQRLATGGWDNQLTIWDASGSTLVQALVIPLAGKGDLLLDMAFRPDSRRVVTGSRQSGSIQEITVNVWDVRSGAQALVLQGALSEFCHSVAYDPTGRFIAAGCFNQTSGGSTLQLWDANSGVQLLNIDGVDAPVAFSPDGNQLTGGDGHGQALKIFDTGTGQNRVTIHAGGVGGVRKAIYSADGAYIVTANGNGTIKVWYANTGQEAFTFSGHQGVINDMVMNNDNTRIVTAGDDGMIVLWDATNGQQLSSFNAGKPVQSVSISADGNYVVTGGDDNILRLFAE
ncbi:RICIN domain-containing protein [Hyphomonas sp.]|uniref:RICIN domain-containing protein n=1 Tax=Hyphomonas sp. TaxID=87 RepID=UPI0039E2170A